MVATWSRWMLLPACLVPMLSCARKPAFVPSSRAATGQAARSSDFASRQDDSGRSSQSASERPRDSPGAIGFDPIVAANAPWSIEPGDDGTFRIYERGKPVASFVYSVWAENWSWVVGNDGVRNLKSVSGVTTFDFVAEALGIGIKAKIWQSGPTELSVEYDVLAAKPLHNVMGGCLEFQVTPSRSEAELLGGHRGFSVPSTDGNQALITFEPAAAECHFERGNKRAPRCFLFAGDVKPGTFTRVLKVKLPSGSVVAPSIAERYGNDDPRTWYPQTLAWNRWPVDVSFLNDGHRPAGRHGRVKANGEDLVFEDGTEARFWGTNLEASALFVGAKADIANQAKRIAALGYNLVRIHHHDSGWVEPNVFEKGNTTQKLNEVALDTLDYWIKCLIDEGVYVWLDLNVGRRFLPGDQIEGYAELVKQEGMAKGFNYVNPRIEKLMQTFAANYLQRVNRYTGRVYAQEPAVVAVLLTNENDLAGHFGHSMLPDKNNPVHQKLFESLVKDFARRNRLPIEQSLQTWVAGPSKIAMNDIEHAFNERAIASLRASGAKPLVATTSYWGDNRLFTLPALTAGDVIDAHAYGNTEALRANPHHEANFVDWIAAAQVAGKPFAITEWNVEYPKRDRFVAPLYVASVAALQGWDAPMVYGYLGGGVEQPEHPDPWSIWNDPALTSLMPAAAVLFRQRHVRQAAKTYRLDLTRESLYYTDSGPDTSAAIRTLAEQSRLTIGLPNVPELSWDDAFPKPSEGVSVVSDLARDLLPAGQTFVPSDTGELRRDWALGIETVDTRLSQAAMGWIGGRKIHLTDVDIELTTPKATIAVTSLDGKPIASSERILLTAVAQVVALDQKLPYLSQPVEGTIRIRATRPLTMRELSPRAYPGPGAVDRSPPVAASSLAGGSTFRLARGMPTHWFLLQP